MDVLLAGIHEDKRQLPREVMVGFWQEFLYSRLRGQMKKGLERGREQEHNMYA